MMKHVLFYSSFLRCTAPILGRYTVFGHSHRNNAERVFLAVFACIGLAGAGAGCEKTLLGDTEERTQYDRYDAIRSQRVPAYVEDEFGRQRPNIKGRLLTKQ